ncbi:MAG TPA: ferric reductase [Nocardioidaceae bacterium]|nr:ferric reductase [Nocardioidaceae bacterium]
MNEQVLWFLNRGTGVVLVAVLTASMVLGITASRGRAGGRLPAFVTQTLHRNLSLLGLALLLVHIATAVLDEYVDIRWWNAVVPWGSSYEPVWVALGALSTDLMLALVLLTALRSHVGQRTWRGVHLTAYAAWLVGLAHGIGIGTDTGERWVWTTYLACAGLLATLLVARSLTNRGPAYHEALR